MKVKLLRFGRPGRLENAYGSIPLVDQHVVSWVRSPILEEWWVNGEQGFEQGFEVAEASDGASEGLLFDLRFEGATIQATDRGFMVVEEVSGLGFSYDHLVAIDAAGAQLPASLETIEGGLRIEVDDSSAIYPISVDPILGYYDYDIYPILSQSGGSSYGQGGIAIWENMTAVGAPLARQVVIHHRSGDSWREVQRLNHSSAGFGTALAITRQGDYLAVGGSSGTVDIFSRDQRDNFALHTSLDLNGSRGLTDRAYEVVTMEWAGSELRVGLPRDGSAGFNASLHGSGSVRFIALNNNSGRFEQTDRVTGVRLFGRALAGNWVADYGVVHRLTRANGRYSLDSSRALVGDTTDCFGASVADGQSGMLMVGAPCTDNNQGVVRVFDHFGTLRRTLTPPNRSFGGRFGATMTRGSTSVPTYVVGEPGGSGRAHIYHAFPTYSGVSYPYEGVIAPANPIAGEGFGQHLAIGAVEARTSVPNTAPYDPLTDPPLHTRPRVSKTGISVVVGGRNRALLFDLDQVAYSRR